MYDRASEWNDTRTISTAANITSVATYLLRNPEGKSFDGDFGSSRCACVWIDVDVESADARGSRFKASSGSFTSCWGMIDFASRLM